MPDIDLTCDAMGVCMTITPQDNCDDCGPAVAHTVIRAQGGQPPSQANLRTAIASGPKRAGFITSPEALGQVISANLPGQSFVIGQGSKFEEGCEMLVKSVLAGSCSASLVQKCGHWVMVSGIGYSGTIGGVGSKLGLKGFHIGNPSNLCVACAGGRRGTVACGAVNRTSFKPLAGWRNLFFTGCPDLASDGGFVSILKPASDIDVEIEFIEQKKVKGWVAIDKSDIVDLVREGFEFVQISDWQVLKAAPRWGWGRIARIERSYQDSFYYLVEMATDKGTLGVANLDGSTGVLLGVDIFSDFSAYPFPNIENNMAFYGGLAKRMAVDMGEAGESSFRASYVWEPCMESPDPIFPFLKIQSSRGREFISSSGIIYGGLHFF